MARQLKTILCLCTSDSECREKHRLALAYSSSRHDEEPEKTTSNSSSPWTHMSLAPSDKSQASAVPHLASYVSQAPSDLSDAMNRQAAEAASRRAYERRRAFEIWLTDVMAIHKHTPCMQRLINEALDERFPARHHAHHITSRFHLPTTLLESDEVPVPFGVMRRRTATGTQPPIARPVEPLRASMQPGARHVFTSDHAHIRDLQDCQGSRSASQGLDDAFVSAEHIEDVRRPADATTYFRLQPRPSTSTSDEVAISFDEEEEVEAGAAHSTSSSDREVLEALQGRSLDSSNCDRRDPEPSNGVSNHDYHARTRVSSASASTSVPRPVRAQIPQLRSRTMFGITRPPPGLMRRGLPYRPPPSAGYGRRSTSWR